VTTSTASCPYCLSDIPSTALVCRHCGRDVSLFRTLLTEIEQLKLENQSLKISLENFEKLGGSSLPDLISDQQISNSAVQHHSTWPLWTAGGLTVMVLALLHWFLFFVYDTPVVVFRVVTFCVPIALGFWAGSRGRSFWLYEWSLALMTGMLSVCAMLYITHYIDEVPLWPQNLRDWRETVEYSVSIALALLTGLLAWGAYERWRRTQANGGTLFLLQRDDKGRLKLEQLTSDVQHLIATIAPLVSGATAVYSALKSLLS
jgi:hypothetical protein